MYTAKDIIRRRKRVGFRKKHPGRAFIAMSALAAAPALFGQNLPVAGDAQVTSAYPATNFGALPFMQAGGPARAYVQFDASNLAGVNAANILRATLTLWTTRLGAAGAVDVLPVTGAWSESAI